MIFVIGGEGFVGSGFVRLLTRLGEPHEVITRANFASFAGRSCDVLINANGNSKKFMADRDPDWEFEASVNSVVRSLNQIKAGAYVHLSTGDVYPSQRTPEETREDLDLEVSRMSRYGLHKYVAETMVRGSHPNWLIFRMGGFVGPGLRKNAIYDMLHDAPVWLSPDSELQVISTDSAANIMWSVFKRGVSKEIVNLGATGVARLGDIYKRIGSKAEFQADARTVRFELSTARLAAAYGATLPSTVAEIELFLQSQGR
jgi:nucleoside-diphosphate-sugar epimerase